MVHVPHIFRFALIAAVAIGGAGCKDRAMAKTDISPKRIERPTPIPLGFSSELPLVLLDSADKIIPDHPKIPASIQVLEPTDQPNTWRRVIKSPINIERRGSSSSRWAKRQYGFEFCDSTGKDVDLALLGMPPGSDWVLYGPVRDKTYLRNVLAYQLFRSLGHWAPRTRFVELFYRDPEPGADAAKDPYQGLYVLTERISRGTGRLEIAAQKNGTTDPSQLSGGYIVRLDKIRGTDVTFLTQGGTRLTYRYPKAKRMSDAQKAWIKNYIDQFEVSIASGGYDAFIDTGSFIDTAIVQELTLNRDAYISSNYFYKDRNGKLKSGPIWDFNLAFKRWGKPPTSKGWLTSGRLKRQSRWWLALFEDPSFVQRFIARWRQVRQKQLSEQAITRCIDEQARTIRTAVRRDMARWRSPSRYSLMVTHDRERDALKRWTAKRANWIDEHIDQLTVGEPRRRAR